MFWLVQSNPIFGGFDAKHLWQPRLLVKYVLGLQTDHKESRSAKPSLALFCKYDEQNLKFRRSIPATVLHQHPAPIHPAAKTSAATLKEVEAVVLNVESN